MPALPIGDRGPRLTSTAPDAAPITTPPEPEPRWTRVASRGGWLRARLAGRERRRLGLALLLSLGLHTLLLFMVFDGYEPGLPGFSLPWRERRVEVPELRVVLAPAPVARAETVPPAAPPVAVVAAPEAAPAVPKADIAPRAAETTAEVAPRAAQAKADVAARPAETKAPVRAAAIDR